MTATGLLPLLLLLLGGHVGPHFGLPPLAEDPLLARMAPEDPIWYFSCAGVADADPKSGNQTEQILAEPEVRDFLHAVDKALSDAILNGAPPTPQGKLLGVEGPKLIRVLLTHPAVAYISKMTFNEDRTEVSGGIVVGTGDETAELKGVLGKLEQTILGAAEVNDANIAPAGSLPATWHKIPASEKFPSFEWGLRGKYLVIGIGNESAEAIWSRRIGKSPTWLTVIKRKLAVEKISTINYIDVRKALSAFAPPTVTGHDQFVLLRFDAASVVQLASISGLDGTGYVNRTWVQTDGEPSGFWSLFGPTPITAADLAPIPKDASLALAVRVRPDRLYATILSGLTAIDLREGRQFASEIKDLEPEFGFRLKEDVLETLGDSCCAYNSPVEGGLLVSGLTIVVPVEHHGRLVKSNEQFVKRLRESNVPKPMTLPPPFAVIESTFKKQTIYCLASNESDTALTLYPAWCITDKQLIVSFSPQNIRAFLSRDPAAGSLADLPVVAAKLKDAPPILLSYEDTAEMLKITYPLLQMSSVARLNELQKQGINLDAGSIPSLASIIHHVRPGLGALSREGDGLMYTSRQSLPVDAAILYVLPLLLSARVEINQTF